MYMFRKLSLLKPLLQQIMVLFDSQPKRRLRNTVLIFPIITTWKMSAIFGRACKPWILLVLLCRQVTCQITGPTKLNCLVGDNVRFRWSTNDKSTILSATWGIKKASIADPQYINVDIRSSKAHINSDLKPDLIKRLSFEGDLEKGLALFILKNVTLNDTNEYLASISYSKSIVLPYTVVLNVTVRKEENGQSEVGSKNLDKKQSPPSRSPRLVQSTTKGTEGLPPKDPNDPVNLNVGTVVLASIGSLVAVAIIIIIVAFLIKKKYVEHEDGSYVCLSLSREFAPK